PGGFPARGTPIGRHTQLVGSWETQRAWEQRSQATARGKAAARQQQPPAALRVGRHKPQLKPVIPAPRAPKTTTGRGESRGRRVVRERSGKRCEIRLDTPRCTGRAQDWHHRKNRSQGGTWAPSNGLAVCRSCHEAVTNTHGRRPEFEDAGWVVASHRDPHRVKVLLAVVDQTPVEPSVWRFLTDGVRTLQRPPQ
ncbi:MAG: HNH endonuclease signature motif containing protein, partial [Acidimicrobiales bacterium]